MPDNFEMNPDDIKELYRRASNGNIEAQNELASRLATGDGLKKNIGEAISWYKKAASSESAEAYFNLAIMHYKGEGGHWNHEKITEYLNISADLGSTDSCLTLAEAYQTEAFGLKKNIEKSFWFYLRATRLGSTKAVWELGEILENNIIPIETAIKIMRHFDPYFFDTNNEQ